MKKSGYLKLWTALWLTVFLSACYDMGTSESKAESLEKGEHVPSVYLVSVNGQYSEKEIETFFAQYGVRGIKRIASQLYQVTLTQDPGLQHLRERATESDVIRHIQRNNIYRKN